MEDEHEVVLVPLKPEGPGSQAMRIERMNKGDLSPGTIHHVAKGPYQGIIISKNSSQTALNKVPDTEKVYTAYIKDLKNEKEDMRREERVLRFWFEPQTKIRMEIPKAITETFFKDLMDPNAFPKAYVSYVIRLLTLVKQYTAIQALEASLRFLSDEEEDVGEVFESDAIQAGPGRLPQGQEEFIRLADGTIVSKHGTIRSGGPAALKLQGGTVQRREYTATVTVTTSQENHVTQNSVNGVHEEKLERAHQGTKVKRTLTLRGKEVVLAARRQNVLNTLEDAYPNVLSVEDIAVLCELKREDVEQVMDDLGNKNLIKAVDKQRFIRMPPERKLVIPKRASQIGTIDKIQEEKKKHEFKMVAHVPTLPEKEQPTIAVVTLLFCEKLAVDSMMDSKTTYIRVKKGEGEGQVYTVGCIGKHRVVSTKLSRIGHKQEAMVAAGNNVTRLLGTFGKLEHVLLVGVGGGVADASDDTQHEQLGDVVIAHAPVARQPVYIHCTEAEGEPPEFKVQKWEPIDNTIRDIINKLHKTCANDVFFGSKWDKYMAEATQDLKGGDTRFERPSADTNKPYRVKGGEEIEFEPPQSPVGSPRAIRGEAPLLHLGVVGAGKMFAKEDELREAFIREHNLRCIDSGFQAVMDSIYGNRKDSFAIIRGVADYQDGTHRREWQGYASLAAAAIMKAIILQLPSLDADSDDEN